MDGIHYAGGGVFYFAEEVKEMRGTNGSPLLSSLNTKKYYRT